MGDAIRAFDAAADTYDDWYRHPQGKQIFEAELSAVESLILDEGVGLDVGAGTGMFAERLTGAERIVVCLEPSSGMMRRIADRGLVAVLGVGSALPLRRGVLDFTYMVAVLEFFDEPMAVLREVRDTAKEGAELTILFINSDSAWGTLYRDIGSKGDPVFRHARLFTMKEVEEMVAAAGYSVSERVGTLTTKPTEVEVGGAIAEPSNQNGVIVLRAC